MYGTSSCHSTDRYKVNKGNIMNTPNNILSSRPTLCALAVCLAFSGNVAAQADSQENDSGLEKIEVTARKVTENLQEVPVAVTSIGEIQLAEKGISVLTEVQQFSPNTTLQKSRGTNSTITAFIRGVGQQDPLWGYEPGVGIYIDDVYIARPQGAVLDLLNVERIEVLRGPQGTLYGKNTIGGAIKYVTKPMTGDTTFNVRATVGSYSQRDLKLTGQIPLIEDKLYFGFGIASLNRNGFGTFLQSELPDQDRENYNKDLGAARATLEWAATESLFLKFNWDRTEDNSNAKGGFRLLPSLLTDAPVPDSVFDSYTSMPTENKVELEGISFTATWEATDDLTLKYVFSDRESDSPTNIDFDNTPLRIFDVPAFYDDEQTTHEIQANYFGDNYKIVGGVYLYDAESCGHFDAILEVLGNGIGFPGLTREVSGCSNSESIAAYVQAAVDLSDKWSMTVGARFTDDEKEAFVRNGLAFETLYPRSGWVPGYVRDDAAIAAAIPMVLGSDSNGDGILDAPAKDSWSRFTPRVGVEYKMNDDVMFFASYGQGFKSGTFNPRAQTNEPAVNPEIVDSFELGMKSDWNDALRANVTIFSLDHKDRQYITALPSDEPGALNQFLGNVGKSEAWGIETDLTFIVTDDLTVTANVGYIDAEFKEVLRFNSVTEQFDNIKDQFVVSNTPEITGNLAANYEISNSLGDWVFNANYYYRDDYAINEENNLLNQEGYGLVNLGLNWYHPDGAWTASLHVKNLTDKEYIVGGYQFVTPDTSDPTNISLYTPGLGGDNTLIGYYGDPRTIHFTVGYQF